MERAKVGSMQRSLRPQEHGAYGELAFPLLTALLLGRLGAASLCLALAAVATFVAHEPLLVALGHRGARARMEDGARARRALLVLGTIATTSGLIGICIGGTSVLLSLVLPALLIAALVPFLRARQERTAIGEVIAASALCAAALPVAVAGGIELPRAMLLWAVWTVAFSVATLEVRVVIARARRGATAPSSIVPLVTAAMLVTTVALVVAHVAPIAMAAGLAPLGTFAIGLRLHPPSPRRLRLVGWLLIATSLLTTVLLVAIRGR
jgi:hypothetical protein